MDALDLDERARLHLLQKLQVNGASRLVHMGEGRDVDELQSFDLLLVQRVGLARRNHVGKTRSDHAAMVGGNGLFGVDCLENDLVLGALRLELLV